MAVGRQPCTPAASREEWATNGHSMRQPTCMSPRASRLCIALVLVVVTPSTARRRRAWQADPPSCSSRSTAAADTDVARRRPRVHQNSCCCAWWVTQLVLSGQRVGVVRLARGAGRSLYELMSAGEVVFAFWRGELVFDECVR